MDDKEFLQQIHTWKHNSIVDKHSLDQIRMVNPSNVLDVGAGDGFYGKLCRYALPNISQLCAIEKRLDYINQWNLKSIYDMVFNVDIIDDPDEKLDLIIFGDVLEHLEKVDMRIVLAKAVHNCKFVLINSPLGFQSQEHEFPEEIHRCSLTKDTFADYNIIEWNEYPGMFNCLLRGEL